MRSAPAVLCRLALVPLAVALALAACGGRRRSHDWQVAEASDVTKAAAKARDQECSRGGESQSRRADPEACGPFPCEDGRCIVSECGDGGYCLSGFCSGGHCLRAEPHGSRSCRPFTGSGEDGDATWAARRGCECVPDSAHKPGDGRACGPFPCGVDGCYVKKCGGDGACEYGVCSGHASSPHGYCVTDDPY